MKQREHWSRKNRCCPKRGAHGGRVRVVWETFESLLRIIEVAEPEDLRRTEED